MTNKKKTTIYTSKGLAKRENLKIDRIKQLLSKGHKFEGLELLKVNSRLWLAVPEGSNIQIDDGD